MKKEDLLSKEFLKQFANSGEFSSFMSELHKKGIESLLEAELDAHLGYDKHEKRKNTNARNGKTKKQIKTDYGKQEIEVPRDREGTFDPVIVPKRSQYSQGIETLIISLYAKGMSNSDIEEQIRELYDFQVSTSTISKITEKVVAERLEWQNRPLESCYLILWMDGIVFKVRENAKVVNKTMYIAIGLKTDGRKEILGLWLGESESAAYWLSVLTDMKARGVEDVLITSTDNLKGFTQAINDVFPQAATQICVVHQIRNSTKFVVHKDRKAFCKDMRAIYTAPNLEAAQAALVEFESIWGAKYPYPIQSWKNNWDNLTTFFDFTVEIRHIIYTTNIIENLNGKIRKYTKNKLSFPTDEALKKSVYLAVREITKKWTMPLHNWGIILNQFFLIYGDRIKI